MRDAEAVKQCKAMSMVKRMQCGQLMYLPVRCGGALNLRGVAAASNLLPILLFMHLPPAAVLSMEVLEFNVEQRLLSAAP